MNITRRGVLRGFAALAATVLVPALPGHAKPSPRPGMQHLIKQMRSGVIENQIFHLDGTIILENIHNLIIRNCVFVFTHLEDDQPMIKFGPDCFGLWISTCTFRQSGRGNPRAIGFDFRENIRLS